MSRVKTACQRAWRKVRNAVTNCKQTICNKIEVTKKKVRDFLWDYPTYAEYVERWTKEIDTYCTNKSITAREDNFEIIKLEVEKTAKFKFSHVGYLIKLVFVSVSKFLSFILPFVLLFFLFPFGGEEGLIKSLWESMIQDQAVINQYKEWAGVITIIGLWMCLTVENIKFAIKDNTAKEMKEASLKELNLSLFTTVRDNQFKFN